jgi:mRNA interferase YafQ
MTSKKSAAEKRANLPRVSNISKTFLRDWDRLSQSGRYDLKKLKGVMLQLIANERPTGRVERPRIDR